ncbi:MAG TPA: hypothetical protein VGE04_04705 [Chloroflexia bacterium]
MSWLDQVRHNADIIHKKMVDDKRANKALTFAIGNLGSKTALGREHVTAALVMLLVQERIIEVGNNPDRPTFSPNEKGTGG